MPKFYKENVGKRQMYRRVALEVNEIRNSLINNNDNYAAVASESSGVFTTDTESISFSEKNCNKDNIIITESLKCNNSADIKNVECVDNESYLNLKFDEGLNNSFCIESEEESSGNVTVDVEQNEVNILSRLQQWALRNHVSHSVFTDLLHSIHTFLPHLPLSSKSVLHTPSRVISNKKKLDYGEYVHFGLDNFLKFFLSVNSNLFLNLFQISFNIDGLPLFKSSTLCFWPILGLIVNHDIPKQKPFAVGVFCGNRKPLPLSTYLEDFVGELSGLLKQGFIFKEKKYSLVVHSFICDEPARAFVKCTKAHGGYSNCDKCTETGSRFKNRIILKSINSRRRTNESFLKQIDEDHHNGVSPLLDLGIDMITKFPVEYMHCLCQGVMKKLLVSWTSGSNFDVRLNGRSIDRISEAMLSLRAFITAEFNRRPRALSDLPRFKATEFRMFLLYVGPLVLKGNIDPALYEHFLLLYIVHQQFYSQTDIYGIWVSQLQKKFLIPL